MKQNFKDMLRSFSLFFLSLLPLWCFVAFRNVTNILTKEANLYTEWISCWGLAVMGVVSVREVFFFFQMSNKENLNKWTLVSARLNRTNTANYLLTYVLPLLVFDCTEWKGAVGLFMFASLLALTAIFGNYFPASLWLEILGFRFYRCRLQDSSDKQIEKIVVSRDELPKLTTKICVGKMLTNNYVLLEELVEKGAD